MQTKNTFSKLCGALLIAFALITSKACAEAPNWTSAVKYNGNAARGFTADAWKSGSDGYTWANFYWAAGNSNQKEFIWYWQDPDTAEDNFSFYYTTASSYLAFSWWSTTTARIAGTYGWITTPGWQGELYYYSQSELSY